MVELLRLAQQAMAPGEPAHFGSADQVVERANTYWAWIKEQTA